MGALGLVVDRLRMSSDTEVALVLGDGWVLVHEIFADGHTIRIIEIKFMTVFSRKFN
jgi:hypothetical protein